MSTPGPSQTYPIPQTPDVASLLFQAALGAAYRNRTWLYNPDIALKRDAAAWEKVTRHPKLAHAVQKRTHMVATREWAIEPGGDQPEDETAAAIVDQIMRGLSGFASARFLLARAPIHGNANLWIEGRRQEHRFRIPPPKSQRPDEELDEERDVEETPEGATPDEKSKKPEGPDKLAAAGPVDAGEGDDEPPSASADEGPKKPGMAGDGKPAPTMIVGDWWTPTRLRHIDYRRIRLVPRWEIVDGKDSLVAVEPHLGSIEQAGAWHVIEHAELLLRVVYDDEEGRLGYGRGLMEAIYWGFWILETLNREGLSGIEKWANGWIVGKVAEQKSGATDKTAEAVAAALLDVLEMMRSRGVLVVGKEDEVDVVSPSGTGHQMLTDWRRDIEDMLVQLLLGSLRPSGGGEGGTYGQGKVEERSTEDVIAFDRQLIDEAITERLIGLIWRLNAPQIEAAGLGDARMPRFVSVESDNEDPKEFLERVKLAQEVGMEVSEEEAYRRSGLRRPAPGEPILKRPAPSASPFGSGLPGFDPKELDALDKGKPGADGPAPEDRAPPEAA